MKVPAKRTFLVIVIAGAMVVALSLVLSTYSLAAVLSAPQAATVVTVTVPARIGFEGFLADGDTGEAITGTHAITFSVYAAGLGGTPLWSEGHAAVQVTNGLYAVELGESAAITPGLFDGGRWIGVTVDDSPELAPRTKVSSVPFALNADTLDGRDAEELEFPPKTVLLWHGDPATEMPGGWQLCDGSNDTPDLSGRFIVGYGAAYADYSAIGMTGGEITHTLTTAEIPSHQHPVDPPSTLTNVAGAHSHNIRGEYPGSNAGIWADNERKTNWSGGYTDTQGNHQHSVNIAPFSSGSEGGGQGHENRPPYFVLAYICKVP